MMIEKIFAAIDLFAKYVGKTVVLTLCGLFALVAIAIIHLIWFWVITSWVKPEWHGSYNLGGGIYMKVWDGNTTHLLEGSSFDGRACTGGMSIIPSHNKGYLSDSVCSIIDAKHDDRWIVSEAVSEQSNKYYFIIDKSFKADSVPISYIYGTYLLGYTDSLEFAKACKNKNIPLTIGK